MDIWKVRLTNNNIKIAQGWGRTAWEALTDLERSLIDRKIDRNDGYRREKR